MTITAAMIDSREPAWIQALAFGGIPTVTTLLDTGDMHVTCDDGTLLVVERKEPNDFLNSLRDERLFTQCANLVHLSRWAYLVITDEFRRGANGKVVTSRETGWSLAAVQGALLAIQEMGVFTVFCGGDGDYEGCIQRLAARNHNPDVLLLPAREARALGLKESLLCGFPGLGPERAAKLLDHCGGETKWALAALTGNDPVPGVPSNVLRNARMLLSMTEGEQLWPMPMPNGKVPNS